MKKVLIVSLVIGSALLGSLSAIAEDGFSLAQDSQIEKKVLNPSFWDCLYNHQNDKPVLCEPIKQYKYEVTDSKEIEFDSELTGIEFRVKRIDISVLTESDDRSWKLINDQLVARSPLPAAHRFAERVNREYDKFIEYHSSFALVDALDKKWKNDCVALLKKKGLSGGYSPKNFFGPVTEETVTKYVSDEEVQIDNYTDQLGKLDGSYKYREIVPIVPTKKGVVINLDFGSYGVCYAYKVKTTK